MIEPLLRRLRVRDDGTGKSREHDSTFGEFDTEDAIVLLGDPGMGKTTFFREASGGKYSTVRRFLVAPQTVTTETVFLDALDEYRATASGQDASAEVARTLCNLQKPRFRLSCRAADWFGSTDQEVLRAASSSGRVVVLELLPLSHADILIAVRGIVPDPTQFLAEAESAGLMELLGNPQTLELVARAWASEKKPRNKFEAYEMGISELLKEVNRTHDRRSVSTQSHQDLRRAAGAVASVLLLANSAGVSRTATSEGKEYIGFTDVPCQDKCALEAVLNRRLFTSPETDRFEPIHRTVAEFLAGKDLAERIENGLPVDQVMAMICGLDGIPVSSLRGLFAWLMCNLGDRANSYVQRDPYAVATYGDASVLPPNAQCSIWSGLQSLLDPWFLASQEDRSSFRGLANSNTAKTLCNLFQDSATRVHLKAAMLDAIANSNDDIGLNKFLRSMVLNKGENVWLRTSAVRAYAKAINFNWKHLEELDNGLARLEQDSAASEVRVVLLCLSPKDGSLPARLLSILQQAAISKTQGATGRFYLLIDLPSTPDLDMILDGASSALKENGEDRFEIQSLFDQWLGRRLESPEPVTPSQLVNWLQSTRNTRSSFKEKVLPSIKRRFEQEPALFEATVDLFLATNEQYSFRSRVMYYILKLLPVSVWPFPHSEFLLNKASARKNPEEAAVFFSAYMASLPTQGGSTSLVQAGWDFLGQRPDVSTVLGDWNRSEIESWRQEDHARQRMRDAKHLENREKSIAYLTPHLMAIREGKEENLLGWAARHYHGWFHEEDRPLNTRERLVSLTNEEIADTLIDGMIKYSETESIPKAKVVIQSWIENSIPSTHTLLSMSVFLRLTAGMSIPTKALPHCIAAALTASHASDKLPGHDEVLSKWVIQQAWENPNIVRRVLRELWNSAAKSKGGHLPGFYEFVHDPDSRAFLALVSADVLRTRTTTDHNTIRQLASVLLTHDKQTLLNIAKTELAREELSAETRITWSTFLFLISPSKHLEYWKDLMAESSTPIWEAIRVITEGNRETGKTAILTSEQRVEIVRAVGRRFPYVGHPIGGWSGDRNPWDAADFVAYQIKQLSTDSSHPADAYLKPLEDDDSITSYHDLVRHHRAQHEKQQRESSFIFARPEEVAEALRGGAPSNSSALLAFIVDHFSALTRELNRTQTEGYRAYWNEDGRRLANPKHEETCSGILARDLQNRIRAQNLIVTVEHHMVADKECDLVVLQGTERLLPIEIKHHYHAKIWTAWHTQLDRLYTSDAKASGLGIYLVLWSGEAKDRKMPKLPDRLHSRPTSASELKAALESLIPERDRHRLKVVVVDISPPF